MKNLPIDPISVSDLEVYANPHDALHDLHTYVQYMAKREVKRMTRTNEIPKADIKRLIKQMTDPTGLLETITEYRGPGWLYFIDDLALRLGLVSYDTKGEYRGYSSQSPSYIKNYIIVSEKGYQKFLELTPAEQEKQIFEKLIAYKNQDRYDHYSENEFYKGGVMGCLDAFTTRGSATGVMPSLDFSKIRRFLFDLLQNCQPGEWYSVASLVAYLKKNQPHFIIPAKIKPNRWEHQYARYSNFYDGTDTWHHRDPIPDDAPDGFERVEGRYIERFFEHIPLTLRLVELAYDPQPYTREFHPMIDYLKAFRLTGRFARLMSGGARSPKVTVQPNFEVVVESEFYPAKTLQQLEWLAEPAPVNASGTPVSVTTLTLKRERVAAALADDPGLDVLNFLEALSAAPLPPNVSTEIGEWSGHAEMFTLYDGFGLLESVDELSAGDAFTQQEIAPHLRLVSDPQNLLSVLEKKGLAPINAKHSLLGFSPLPDGVQSVFPKIKPVLASAPPPPEPVIIQKTTTITLTFPFDEVFDVFRRALAEARVPVQADAGTRSLTFSDQFMPALKNIIQQLDAVYDIQLV
jgi:hypothetical protein